ncbi:CaiB/BaiF CoA transferase family protein [Plastoroseomonas hellenica]|uniref:CaiB/BaiF CoA transferase family protein n=1 Tax=Plastoroseomonas hellenica TaxID=2687306 RepID=UPI001BA7967F|nr:CoA transferase [Plastoroseomonas hellenica]MBR0643082.1 CoA transferase [Plastoroseomonas hellenica]
MSAPLALDGLLVLDLTTFLSGPYCTMMLGDLGAEVIKVERPEGDEARRMPPFVEERSQPFALWNRNKRSIALDLKSPADAALLWRLVGRADVLVENFRPGALARAGFGWPALHAANPRLVLASISGFGQTGPWAQHGGFDMMAQGMSGLMAGNGPPDGEPYRLPIAITDLAAGMFTMSAVLAALLAREKTGEGQQIDQSLFEAGLALGVYEAAHVLSQGTRPERMGQLHRGNSPYRAFRTRDGWITIGANKDAFWRMLCDVIGRPDLPGDPRFATNADRVRNNDALVPLLQAALDRESSAHWLEHLGAAGIPAEAVLAYDEALAHPQAVARGVTAEIADAGRGPTRTLASPLRLGATPAALRRRAPDLDEHGAEIRAWLGG